MAPRTSRKRRPAGEELELPPLTGPQIEVLEAVERCVDVEGAVRAAKSTGVGFKLWQLVWEHPGIQILYARWKDEDVQVQLKDLWRNVQAFFPEYLHPAWNASEQAFDFPNQSRVYVRSLKSSEDSARYSKVKGLTLAVIIIEEANEVPHDIYLFAKGRLSQSVHPITKRPYPYPLQIILVTNPVDEDHWIAEEFPDGGGKPWHRYIRADIWSNAVNLGPAVIEGYEQDFPPGHPLRRTQLEGRRGVNVMGKPCYEGYFDQGRHVSELVVYSPFYPLLEGWDFSHSRPAVIWAQYLEHLGALWILGGVQGFEMFLEVFAPHVLSIRQRWFPQAHEVWSWCDPAGATNTSGTRVTAISTLQDNGVYARHEGNANNAPERYAAIQTLGGMMLRQCSDGSPAFMVNPRCLEIRRARGGKIEERPAELIATALQVGYVWDDDHAPPQGNPNVRRPKKNFSGDKYSHLMNGLEYVVLGERLILRASDTRMARAGKRIAQTVALPDPAAELHLHALALAREAARYRDHDPMDRQLGRGRYRDRGSGFGSRGGWR